MGGGGEGTLRTRTRREQPSDDEPGVPALIVQAPPGFEPVVRGLLTTQRAA
jgi:hypothetical protein